MRPTLSFGAPRNAREMQAVKALWAECFGPHGIDWDGASRRFGPERTRAARRGDDVVGALCLYRMGQWLGGKAVPSAGIAAVGTMPHARGEGVAHGLMVQTLREERAQGTPLATLYPASRALYRKSGFELGGNFYKLALDPRALSSITASLPVTPLPASHRDVLERVHRERARRSHGAAERDENLWLRIVEPLSRDETHAFVIGTVDQPEGYVVYQHAVSTTHRYDVLVRDWAALTPGAAARLLRFFGQFSSLAGRVVLPAAPSDPILALLPEKTYRIDEQLEWFVRLVHVGEALARRGYPPTVDAEHHLSIEDGILSENAGTWILRTSGGEAEVTRGGRGDVRVSARALPPLYTGAMTPQQLAALGWLTGPEPKLAALAATFASPPPTLGDFF